MKIGVFDSGVGGLTVLRALLPRISNAEVSISRRYGAIALRLQIPGDHRPLRRLQLPIPLDQGCEFLVIACNTASALALDEICETAEPRGDPVVGVIGPGASAASVGNSTRDALVIATSATVQSHAYACGLQAARVAQPGKSLPLAGAPC